MTGKVATLPPDAFAPTGQFTAKVERRRWHMIAIFGFQQLINTAMWITFSPIALETKDLYKVHVMWVNTLSLISLALFLPGMILCSYITTKLGLRYVVLVAAALQATAGVVRYASVYLLAPGREVAAFAVLFLGQTIGAFAQPICTNLPVRIAGDWFPVSERDTATTLGNVGFGLGNLVGMGVPGYLVWTSVDSSLKNGVVVHGVDRLLFAEFALSLCGFVWTWVGFVEEPEEPPSVAAAEKRKARRQIGDTTPGTPGPSVEILSKLRQDYIDLLRNRNFNLVLFSFCIGLGLFNSVFTVLEQLLRPAGYGPFESGVIGNTFILGGVFTSAVVAQLLDKTHAYGLILKACFTLTALTTANMFLNIRPDSFYIVCIVSAIMGAACLPLLPVSLAVVAEVSYPIPEEASTGLLIFSGNLAGVAFTMVYGYLIPMASRFLTVWTPSAKFTLVAVVLATFASMMLKEDNRRFDAEKKQCLLEQGGSSVEVRFSRHGSVDSTTQDRKRSTLSASLSGGLGGHFVQSSDSIFSQYRLGEDRDSA